ncbi:metallophosphoesterase [Gemmobacter serpentinus]|uniref:metallophosphoesterase n=1 Tax=Gemmobacter serpentinus TaxID=2652247 RepID=UPI00124F5DC8|nr:metallophosphoesterase [Gemmobacter serpentinus]
MRAYAIGDIHGHLDLLKTAHDLIADDSAREGVAPVIHVGDLIDRGPDSRGVVDYLMQGQTAGQDWIVLKGNHDRMMELFLRDPQAQDPGLKSVLSWLHPRLGGGATLASYGVHAPSDRPLAPVHTDALAAVPRAHRDWLMARPTQYPLGDCLFVHAGIRPGAGFADQVEDDLVWIREPFLSDPREHGALIVHGHTALDAATHYGNRLNLDSGAAYGGPLSAVVIEGREAWLLTPAGRKPLLPVTPG